jgi:hypothetical protein
VRVRDVVGIDVDADLVEVCDFVEEMVADMFRDVVSVADGDANRVQVHCGLCAWMTQLADFVGDTTDASRMSAAGDHQRS